MGNPLLVSVDDSTYAFPIPVQNALDARNSKRFGSGAAATITPKMAADLSYEYEVIRISLNSQPWFNVFEKGYPGSWVQGAAAPGASQVPADAASSMGAYTILSSDAFETSRMTGIQIKGGVIYEQNWGSADAAPTGKGIEALGFRRDGSWKIYTQAAGDRASTMVADGVDTTFGFGPAVVRNGAVRDIESDSTWAFFSGSVSARAIIGRASNGDIIHILVKGKSGVSGIKGNTIGQLALAEGCVDAILLDGGGTAQGFSNGRYFHPSSDTGGTRTLRSAIAVRIPNTGPTREAPYLIPYLNSAVAINSYPQQATKTDGVVRLSGTVGIASAVANTWYTVGLLPERFRPSTPDNVRFPLYANQNGYTGVASIDVSGNLLVKFAQVLGSSSSSWAQLDGVTYPAAY